MAVCSTHARHLTRHVTLYASIAPQGIVLRTFVAAPMEKGGNFVACCVSGKVRPVAQTAAVAHKAAELPCFRCSGPSFTRVPTLARLRAGQLRVCLPGGQARVLLQACHSGACLVVAGDRRGANKHHNTPTPQSVGHAGNRRAPGALEGGRSTVTAARGARSFAKNKKCELVALQVAQHALVASDDTAAP